MTVDAHADPIRAAVGVSIRRARLASGMSMRDFATRSGLSQPFVSAVERGMSTPSIATLYRMAEVLGMEPANLLPSHPTDGVAVIRADEGQLVPSSDRPGSTVGRVLLADPDRRLEIYEYVIEAGDDLNVWYDHPGDVVLHLSRDECAWSSRVALPSSSIVATASCTRVTLHIAGRWSAADQSGSSSLSSADERATRSGGAGTDRAHRHPPRAGHGPAGFDVLGQ